MIIDGKNHILGRIANVVAKKALEGEKVDLVNCEEIIITGKKEEVLKKFKQRRERGNPHKGPFYPRMADRLVRRTIRGMLPYKQEKGRKAYDKIKCHIGVPENLKEKITEIKPKEIKTKDFIRIKEVSSFLGGK